MPTGVIYGIEYDAEKAAHAAFSLFVTYAFCAKGRPSANRQP